MEIIRDCAMLGQRVELWRRARDSITLVPTMGNLHSGHRQLVRQAQAGEGRVIVSIFVNPLQFGAGEDFVHYPRTPQQDADALDALGVDVLFAPTTEEVLQRPLSETTRVTVPGISEELCGHYRPGHFTGVATIVNLLFNLVQPHAAVFGQKDFQQLMVIRRMVADLHMSVEIIGVPTVREADGLALSSRNRYLSPLERRTAPLLYATLQEAVQQAKRFDVDLAGVERNALATLDQRGFKVEYVAVRRQDDLAVPEAGDEKLVILAAAWLGKTRLIDNILFSRTPKIVPYPVSYIYREGKTTTHASVTGLPP